jgi:hypothetical protein
LNIQDNAYAGGGFPDTLQSATLTVDPQFFIDLNQGGNNPADFALFFSDGVVNTPSTSATPLPAALPLFATGLGGLGLFGWRRKRRAQSVA